MLHLYSLLSNDVSPMSGRPNLDAAGILVDKLSVSPGLLPLRSVAWERWFGTMKLGTYFNFGNSNYWVSREF